LKSELTIKRICPDFDEWPDSWAISREDNLYGQDLLKVFAPFIQHLIDIGLVRKTIRCHLDNLWILGGGLIEEINANEESRKDQAFQLIMENISDDGGPYCHHLDSKKETRSFDATCRKLYKFIQ
jgi:hypothetical protein